MIPLDATITLITESLIVAAVVVAVGRSSLSGLVFILPMAIHYLFKDSLEGVVYFSSSGLLSAMTVCLVIRAFPERRDIMWLALACIVADLVGLAMWAAYLEPYVYAISFIIIYSTSILIIGKGDARGSNQHFSGIGGPSLSFNVLRQCNFKHKEET